MMKQSPEQWVSRLRLRLAAYGLLCFAVWALPTPWGAGVCLLCCVLLEFALRWKKLHGAASGGGADQRGGVLWFTGLSASGKSTLAELVYRRLVERGIRAEHLDGDKVREIFPQTGFDRDARNEHIRRIGYLASKLERHGVFVIASFISPYRESRDFVRGICRNFIEVYLNPPIDVCIRRDPKGLYRKALDGKITNFTGVQDVYEEPSHPELTLDTSQVSIDDAVAEIKKLIF